MIVTRGFVDNTIVSRGFGLFFQPYTNLGINYFSYITLNVICNSSIAYQAYETSQLNMSTLFSAKINSIKRLYSFILQSISKESRL